MPNPKLSRQAAEEAIALVRKWGNMALAAREAKLPSSTLEGRLKAAKRNYGLTVEGGDTTPPEVKEAVGDFARSAGVTPRPAVTSEYEDEDIGEVWQRAEAANLKHISRAQKQHVFATNFSEDRPIGVAFVSDQHIASGAIDLARMRADAEYIRDTPNLYALLLGDGVDNHIKHRGALIGAEMQPDDQYRLFDYYLSIFGAKILALCSGNHEAWTVHFAGIDMVRRLAENKKIAYAPAEFFLSITVGGQEYTVAARHQYRMNSSFNETHAAKQFGRLGERDADIIAIGHHHAAAVETCYYRGQPCTYIRPGSYQISSGHTKQYGYNSAYPTCPTVVLYPRSRHIVGLFDLRDAGQFLRGLA